MIKSIMFRVLVFFVVLITLTWTVMVSAETVVYCGKSARAHYHNLMWQGFTETVEPSLTIINATPDLASHSDLQIADCLNASGDVYVVSPINAMDARWDTFPAPIIAMDSSPAWATITVQYDFSIIAETLPKKDIMEIPGTLVLFQDKSQQKPKPNKDDMTGKYIFVGGHGKLTKELLDMIRDTKRPASVLDISPRSIKALQDGDIDYIFQRNPYAMGQAAAQAVMKILSAEPVENLLVPIDIIQANTLTDDLDRVHIPQGIKDVDPDKKREKPQRPAKR